MCKNIANQFHNVNEQKNTLKYRNETTRVLQNKLRYFSVHFLSRQLMFKYQNTIDEAKVLKQKRNTTDYRDKRTKPVNNDTS